MISDGSGMHALSIAIISTTPPYPSAEIVEMMKAESAEISLSSIFSRTKFISPTYDDGINSVLLRI
jgi:hypothetical protein